MGDNGLLSDAIRLLVDRFPSLPPSDSWKYLDPQLAATIHLRYLDAYTQNQQLLLHLCDKQREKAGTFTNSTTAQMNGSIGLDSQNNLISHRNYSDTCNVGDIVPYNNHQEIVPYSQINNQYSDNIDHNDSVSTIVPFSLQNNFNQPTLSIPMNNDIPINTIHSASPNGGKSPKSGIQGITFNRYKNSWCVSSVDADGLRRRKFFNIRKYGFDGARSLALDYLLEYQRRNFSSQSSLQAEVVFDRKERNLVQDILSKHDSYVYNSDSYETGKVNIAEIYNYSEKFRQKFSDICGLIFIPGILILTTVTYDNAGKRIINKFPIQNSSFEDASQLAIANLQNAYKRSKICGILPFHADKCFIYATCYDLNIDITKSFSLKEGFVAAHKKAIAFRKGVVKNMKKTSDETNVSGIIKFPGVYYDSYSKCWVSSCSYSGIRKEVKFYTKKHGEICARELAIRHRMKWMKNKL
ncbi:hypothetical protein BMR1_02g04170 [Babesia microti strain RI]|uniref:AP2/ERF domain-containing protein n=1 Tax=Babesia microti (strain RI) TaxID=1133968 RepID=I7IQQ8_BABMR|nr:hypothetical protein BMR1_02g04170 [Babesia microti strain RI]CCF73980.1 hypothetical protein BMR1_02g04170 [Babesia microti strain RI]|eukprot:XP_012648589.1 hypothetical protein BMR1_02g04170 [Babesia microti strain RI]